MGGEIRVLHVEDEPEFAAVTAEVLEAESGRLAVETAADAEEGFDRLTADGFDCVVSDYDMPGRNGIEFLHAVRERFPDIPFILFTGRGSESVASEAISAGVTDYLQKESKKEQYTVLANRIIRAVEKYRAEQQLERQNDLFRKAQELANVGAWAYDRESGRIRWSEQVHEMHGVSEEFEPTLERLAEFYHPQDQPRLNELTRRAVQEGEPYETEHRFTSDEELRWFRTAADPQVEDGDVVRVRGAVHDVTERKRQEADLTRRTGQLSAVASLADRELRGPLSDAAAQLALASEQCDSDHLARAGASLQQGRRRVDALLTVARGDEVSHTERVSLQAAAEACRERADAGAETLRVDDDVAIQAEPALLAQLLDAFVAVATDDAADVRTVDDAADPQAEDDAADSQAEDDAADSQAEDVTVGVIDGGFVLAHDGPGLPEAERERVLDGDATTRRGGQLAVVRQLAEAHGWDVGLTDSETGGTRVEITDVDVVE